MAENRNDRAYVCVIDADPAVRDSLETLIKLAGFEVKSFATGYSFWNAIEDAGENAVMQCVLCEAELPDVSGFDVHEYMVKKAIDAPFGLLVSGNRPSLFQRAKAAGIQHVYRKPLTRMPLIEFVSRGL